MKILFIINPIAGGIDHQETIESLQELVKNRGFKGEFYFTNGREDEQKIRQMIEKAKPDKVVVGGGDGTRQDDVGPRLREHGGAPATVRCPDSPNDAMEPAA